VLAGHGDARTFTSGYGVTPEIADHGDAIIGKSPPEHTWAKGLMMRMFRRGRMEALAAFIRKRVVELLETAYEEFGPDREFDLVEHFSLQLPLEVIGELCGIPKALHHEFHELSDALNSRGSDRDEALGAQASDRMGELFLPLVQARRANPGDDVISELIAAEVTDTDGVTHSMTDELIVSRFKELGFAGHETVAKAIPNALMFLQAFPEQRRKLAADRSLLPTAVDEVLRYDPPSQMLARTSTCEVERYGITIPKGERFLFLIGSAHRDPREFENPDDFDVARPLDHRSLFFGFGVHKCLGMHLARQEISTTLNEIFDRFPNYEVDPTRATRLVQANVRGVSSLPIRLGKTSQFPS